MYQPSHFEEKRTEVLHQLIRDNGLGTFVTLTANGLEANHIPFEIDPEPAPYGTLRAHVARNNPVWREFSKDVDALVVFQGAQVYISPNWYQTKKDDGKVVPTYNYMVVHAYGAVTAIEDAAWLRALVGRLTDRYEAPQAAPWKVADAPDDYVEKMLSAIVGIEIPINKLIGKWKVSQNRPAVDRAGVIAGLQQQGGEDANAMAVAVQTTLP
ncbi:MAG TPA: FMN-binding negative transcriptional regulator [Burkholderiaceae bacterium]|jgi:transcriptional regulator|nr:FMN-binding negative transcriptional regulator [Burkholderiaceae bacterium]